MKMPHFKHLIFFTVIICSLHHSIAKSLEDFEDDVPTNEDIVIVDGEKYEGEKQRQLTRRQLPGLYGGPDANAMLQEAFAQAGIDLASSSSNGEQEEEEVVPPKLPLLQSLASRVRNMRLPSFPQLPALPSLSASIQSAFARRRVTPVPSMLIPIMGRPHLHGGMQVLPPVLPPPPPTNVPGGVNTNGVLQVKGPAFVTTPYFHPTNLADISKKMEHQGILKSAASVSDSNDRSSNSGNPHHVVVITPPVVSSSNGMKTSASDSNHHFVIVKPTPHPIPLPTQMTSRPMIHSSSSSPVSLTKPRFVKINFKDSSSASWVPSSLSGYAGYSGFKPIPTTIHSTQQQHQQNSLPSSTSTDSQIPVSVSNNSTFKQNDTHSSSSLTSSSTKNYKNSIKYYENLFSNFQQKDNWFKPIEKYKNEHWKVSHSVNDSYSPEESSNEVVRSIMTANGLYNPISSASSSSESFGPIRFKKPTTTMTSFTINPSALLEQISKVNTNRNSLSCTNKDLGWCDYSDNYPE
jgi:hypothetical protein